MKTIAILTQMMLFVSACGQHTSNTSLHGGGERKSRIDLYTAEVTVWSEQGKSWIEQVPIRAYSQSLGDNPRFQLEGLPDRITANNEGCFCFSQSPALQVYIDTYYYADNQLLFYNRFLERPAQKLTISIQEVSDLAPSGSAGGTSVSVTHTGFLDPSILAHELGHIIHEQIRGSSAEEWREGYASADLHTFIEQAGINEGTANLFAALFLQASKIGFASYEDVPTEINAFQSIDNIVTIGDVITTRLASDQFTSLYPNTEESLRSSLADEGMRPYLNLPDPYWASAIINQSLWQLSKTIGRDRVIEIYANALRDYNDYSSYTDLADRLVKEAGPSSVLYYGYMTRGLL